MKEEQPSTFENPQQRYDKAREQRRKKARSNGPQPSAPQFIDMSNWDTEQVPPREWAVANRIPLRQVTLLSGEGAIGKTLLALQLSVAHVLGRDWLGTRPEPGPAIYIGCEDEEDEIHRRLAEIAKHYGVRFADLVAGGLHLVSFAGKDAILGNAGRDGIVRPTPLFERLYQICKTITPRLITFDTVSDIYAGDENNRAQVRQFVAFMRGLAINVNAGVLMCSHPSLTGISSGSGLSGSTGWNNSLRARMYLSAVATEKGEEPDKDLRQLDFMKNNYGPLAEKILLRWENGVFVHEFGASSAEEALTDAKADNLFLDLLRRFAKQGRNVSPSRSPTFAPTVFADQPEAKAAKVKAKALAAAMERLLAANKIKILSDGPPSRRRERVVEVGPEPSVRVVGDAPSGTACIHCHSSEGQVCRIKNANAIGSKPETLHKECAAAWFEAVR